MADPAIQPPLDDLAPRHDVPLDGRSGFVLIGGRQVHYLEWGHRGRPPVLCLHGGGQTAYMWEEVGAALRSRYHLIAPDLPGHGDSDPLEATGFSRQVLAESLLPLLVEFGLDRFTLIGASLGGITGITFAAAHRDHIDGLVLIDIGHRLEDAGVARIVEFMSAHESFASLEEAADAIGEYVQYRRSFRPEGLSRNLRQRDDGRWVWKHRLGRVWRERLAESGGDFDYRQLMTGLDDDAASLDIPVLLLRGKQSDVLSGDAAEELMAILRHGRLETVEKAGHLAAGDNPHSTVSLVGGFLDELHAAGD